MRGCCVFPSSGALPCALFDLGMFPSGRLRVWDLGDGFFCVPSSWVEFFFFRPLAVIRKVFFLLVSSVLQSWVPSGMGCVLGFYCWHIPSGFMPSLNVHFSFPFSLFFVIFALVWGFLHICPCHSQLVLGVFSPWSLLTSSDVLVASVCMHVCR